MQQEHDAAEKELREKETKILSLQREFDELQDKYDSLERQKAAQQRELEDLVSSKDDVGKNVRRISWLFEKCGTLVKHQNRHKLLTPDFIHLMENKSTKAVVFSYSILREYQLLSVRFTVYFRMFSQY